MGYSLLEFEQWEIEKIEFLSASLINSKLQSLVLEPNTMYVGC